MKRHRVFPALLVHGGCGNTPENKRQLRTIEQVLSEGYASLEHGKLALDVVEDTIRVFENSGLFNAGKGAKLQLDGHLRLDASLMEGERLRAGAVAGIEGIRNPISVARAVLEASPHVLLIGAGAARFARYHKLPKMGRPSLRQIQLLKTTLDSMTRLTKFYKPLFMTGTVGVVALDRYATVAAGASTGGAGQMLPVSMVMTHSLNAVFERAEDAFRYPQALPGGVRFLWQLMPQAPNEQARFSP